MTSKPLKKPSRIHLASSISIQFCNGFRSLEILENEGHKASVFRDYLKVMEMQSQGNQCIFKYSKYLFPCIGQDYMQNRLHSIFSFHLVIFGLKHARIVTKHGVELFSPLIHSVDLKKFDGGCSVQMKNFMNVGL